MTRVRSVRTSDVMLSPPATKAGKLQRACLEVLREHEAAGELPTSVRFVYYQLKQAGYPLAHHAARRDDQDVVDAVFRLREAGLVPWEWIADETRSVSAWGYGPTIAAAVEDSLPQMRIDLWGGGPPPLILCEARTLAGVLRPAAARYLCPVAATNGQAGGFLRTDIVPLLVPGQAVAYFGDHNVAGSLIENNTRRVLERPGRPLEWDRLAVTAEQAQAHDLPPKPGTDRRYRDGAPHVSYEAEALGQSAVIAILTGWLDARLPEPIGDVLAREQDQREDLAALLAS